MAFKVQIIDTDHNFDNIILVNDLTIERLKIKYNWILNASVKNCILGENSEGLVWYSGEWICGEWMTGTWYSGIWHDGIWNNGKWYSYDIDKSMIISNRLVVLNKNYTYSTFESGTWIKGDFYDGTFGMDRDISNKQIYEVTNRTFQCAYWNGGNFHTGIFFNSVWFDGVFYNGNMSKSYWANGKFYSGTFNKHQWYNGEWFGGDFIEGDWINGYFDQIDIKSRFGTANLYKSQTNWNNGVFRNGEFHAGLNIDISGNTLPSIDSNKSHWFNGEFNGGKWYGGQFHNGNFNNGNWYGGIFGTDTGHTNISQTNWYSGNWFNGLWINGTFHKGHFYNGMWLDGDFINGYLSTNIEESILLKEKLTTDVYLPALTAYTMTNILYNDAICNGRVTNNGGGTILDRGVCWSTIEEPFIDNTINNWYLSDGGSMGSITMKIDKLANDTTYYMRIYATNITGTTFSNEITFKTKKLSDSYPQVIMDSDPQFTDIQCIVYAIISSSDSTVTSCGFYYSSTNSNPDDTCITVLSPTIPAVFPGKFQAVLLSLTPKTLYYYKPFAVNSFGTGVSVTVHTFTTNELPDVILPTVNTYQPYNIIDVSAQVKGLVTNNGNSTLTFVGVCWSLSANPVIGVPGMYTEEPTTMGQFISTMTSLTPNTTYHARAYATNSLGTGYGEDFEFKTLIYTNPTVIILNAVPV